MSDFTNKVILITGATGGLGGAIVDVFLNANATVVAVGRSIESREDVDRFLPFPADLTSAEGAESAVEAALKITGNLDAVVHVMGAFAGGQPVEETSDDTLDKMLTLNLKAALYVCRAALPPMKNAGYGRIVAIGSRSGVAPSAGLSAYNISKAALNSLIQTVAIEAQPHGITANVVMPSVIDTPANRKAQPDADFSAWVTPESIASTILWLCSAESKDTSGALIPIYGRS
jgi:NAD(P)-dependent dehydrogenase (short-subunit alcohol dehydrogenase family)